MSTIRVILENINCHTTAEFLINKFQITLLKGASGIGKSSIFQAITWCLYGKLRGICTFGATKYSVTVIFGEFTIFRKGKPRLLQITVPGNPTIYEDDVAQSTIDQYFGNEDIWYASCYIEQDARSPLLSGSNNERMDLLNRLSFWSDNPDYYLDKIDEEIKVQQAKLAEAQVRYQTECDLFTQQLTKRPVDGEILAAGITVEYLSQLKNKIESVQRELGTRGIELQNQHKIMGSLDTLRTALARDSSKLETYKSVEEYDFLIEGCEARVLESTLELEKIKASLNLNDDGITSRISEAKSKIKEIESLINQRRLYELSIIMYEGYISRFNQEENKLKMVLDTKKADLERTERTGVPQRPEGLKDSQRPQGPKIQEGEWNIIRNRNELSVLNNQEQQRADGMNVCKNLNVEYNQQAINATIESLKLKIQEIQMYRADLEIIKNIEMLNTKIKALPKGAPDVELIKQLEMKYQDMLLSKGVLKCPHCKGAVRYTNYNLEPESKVIYTSEEIVSTKQQLDTLKKELADYHLLVGYQNQIKELVKVLKVIKMGDDGTFRTMDLSFINELDNYNQVLLVLQRIKYIEPPSIPAAILSKIIEYQEASAEYSKFVKSQDITNYLRVLKEAQDGILRLQGTGGTGAKLEDELVNTGRVLKSLQESTESRSKEYTVQINKIQNIIININSEKSNASTKRSEVGYITNQITTTRNQITSLEATLVPGLDTQIDKLKQDINWYLSIQDKGTYALEMVAKQGMLKEKADHINTTTTSMADLYSLRQTAFDLECNHLQTTVDSINESMNSVLEDIFDKPIKVILQLYKKNKTNDKIKSSVNLNIQYDGNEYDSIAKLSGGEKDRVSFALTLALSRINGCPLLFLDETMTSLNDTLRTACLDCLRKFLGTSKTVVCINHEDVEGNYDGVIEMK